MKSVLIVGCGYVGTGLAARLRTQGLEVVALRRQQAVLPEGVKLLQADVLQPETLQQLERFDAVVYLVSAGHYSESAYQDAYFEGFKNVIRAISGSDAQTKRVIFVSSTAVYHQQNGEWVDELSETRPQHFSGQALLLGEQLLADLPIEHTALRFGGIYGPGRSSIIRRVRAAEEKLSTGASQYTNRIHLDDCVGALEHLLFLPELASCYLGVDSEPADRNDVIRWLAKRLAVPIPETPEVGVLPALRGNKRCQNERLRSSGYEFVYPTYREGLASLL